MFVYCTYEFSLLFKRQVPEAQSHHQSGLMGILRQQTAGGAQHFFQCFGVAVGLGIADDRRDRFQFLRVEDLVDEIPVTPIRRNAARGPMRLVQIA